MVSTFSKHKNSIRRKNYQNNSTSICKRKREIYSENIGTRVHGKLKAKKRFHYDQQCARKNKGPAQGYGNIQGKRNVTELYLHLNIGSQVAAHFKIQIKEGPYYICVVYNRCLYENSVISFKIENYEDVNAVHFFWSCHMMEFHIYVENVTKQ